jgi:hypothetical protein
MKLPKKRVVIITNESAVVTIVFFSGTATISIFNTRPNAIAPLMRPE